MAMAVAVVAAAVAGLALALAVALPALSKHDPLAFSRLGVAANW